jgi:anti-sigma regulatory factor (Ser/Thr protein kinase)
VLVVSELVANVVVHARTLPELSFAAGDQRLEVAVSDDRRFPAVRRSARLADEKIRGGLGSRHSRRVARLAGE